MLKSVKRIVAEANSLIDGNINKKPKKRIDKYSNDIGNLVFIAGHWVLRKYP